MAASGSFARWSAIRSFSGDPVGRNRDSSGRAAWRAEHAPGDFGLPAFRRFTMIARCGPTGDPLAPRPTDQPPFNTETETIFTVFFA